MRFLAQVDILITRKKNKANLLPPTIAFATGTLFQSPLGSFGSLQRSSKPPSWTSGKGKGKGKGKKRVERRKRKGSDGFRRREGERKGTRGRGRREDEGGPPQTSAINPLVSLSVGLDVTYSYA